MKNKGTIIIVIIAVALITCGGYFISNSNQFGNDGLNDGEFKTYSFKNFDIDAPNGLEFKINNSNEKMIYYQNVGDYSDEFSGIIINKNLTDTILGDQITPLSNTSNEKVYSAKIKNDTTYKIVTTKNNIDIIIIGNNLNLLKEIANTTKIKNNVLS